MSVIRAGYNRCISFSPGTSMRHDSMAEPLKKRTVIVHVTFLKIGEIDTKKECFDADVLVAAKWRESQLDRDSTETEINPSEIDWSSLWNPKLYIENVIGEPKVTASLSLEYSNENEAFISERWRCKSTFLENLELLEFPFDVQDLSVNVMSELHSNEVVLMNDPHNVHRIYKQSFIDEQEWHLYKYIEAKQIATNQDKVDPSITRPSLLVMCRAARRPEYFVWNIFSVTLLISCLVFVTFAVDETLVQNRLALTFTLVLTAVAFKFTVNQSLPKISYLTYLDRYILANMVLIAFVALWHGIQSLIPAEKHPRKNLIAVIVLASTFVLYNLVFIANILKGPFKTRRKMNRLEAEYIATVAEQSGNKKKTQPRFSFKPRTKDISYGNNKDDVNSALV